MVISKMENPSPKKKALYIKSVFREILKMYFEMKRYLEISSMNMVAKKKTLNEKSSLEIFS
jgi:hypothetical protein